MHQHHGFSIRQRRTTGRSQQQAHWARNE
jgi:hypothetical protein